MIFVVDISLEDFNNDTKRKDILDDLIYLLEHGKRPGWSNESLSNHSYIIWFEQFEKYKYKYIHKYKFNNMTHIMRIDEMFSKHHINEGAGAGYTITLDGLELDKNSVKIISDEIKYAANDKYGYMRNLKCMMWEASIKPSVLEKWSAIGYYDGVDSDEFDIDDKRVNGGIVRGYVDIGSVMDWTEDTKYTKSDVVSFIQSCIDNTKEINIEVMYVQDGCIATLLIQ